MPLQSGPRRILYGHDEPVSCVAVSSDMDMVASGAADGTIIIHSLRRGRHLYTVQHTPHSAPDHIALSDAAARMLVYSHGT